MKKRIKPILLAIVICIMLVYPFSVYATELDTYADASLTLHYQKDGTVFPDLKIEIFRVAEAFQDGTFELIAPFSSYPVNIHDITQQSEWKNIANTLSSYIVADQIIADHEKHTNEEGTVSFSDLETGLYLVRDVVAENAEGVYIFDTFMIYVPTPQPDGSYEYHVEAKPKSTSFVPKNQYTVTKLWRDDGSQGFRPKEVTVDIYKDSVLFETQILSAENNWSYTWYVTGDDSGKWTVTEREVPDSYKVTIRQNGDVFSIINATQPDPGDPPQTGDTSNPLLWIIIMCFSGIMLLILGIYGRRRK